MDDTMNTSIVNATNKAQSEIETRIIGGSNVLKDTYPWFALAMTKYDTSLCGGTLITPEYVLTAAHCAIRSAGMSKFNIGALCRNRKHNCSQKNETIALEKVTIHPSFNPNTMSHDLALVRLAYRSTIQPVPAIDQGSISSQYTTGYRNLYTMGFGTKSTSDRYRSTTRLKQVEIAYVNATRCAQAYLDHHTNRTPIDSTMLCAIDPGEDSCFGDSGGPLYDSNENMHALVGVVSFGSSSCGSNKYPGVYSRVGSQWSWIQDTVCLRHSLPLPDFCNKTDTTPVTTNSTNTTTIATDTSYVSSLLEKTCSFTRYKKILKLRFMSDDFGSDTYFLLKKNNSETIIKQFGIDNNYDRYGNSLVHEESFCLLRKSCYQFTMGDRWGDGICCENGFGWYELYWDGMLIRRSNFTTDFQETTLGIGDRC